MKIYTRKGDGGETGLIGGTRVPKDHVRIEAYGTIDEANSSIGVLRDQDGVDEANNARLVEIQEELFTIGSHLANDPEKSQMQLPDLNPELIEKLESWMDEMNDNLPPMTNFILPGGQIAASHCHMARCICRRAERATITLSRSSEIENGIVSFLNRLSDYLFVLARYLSHELKGIETPWKPRG